MNDLFMNTNGRYQRGFSVVEILVVIGVGFIFLLGVVRMLQFSKQTLAAQERKLNAVHVMAGSLEAVRVIRDTQGWSSVSIMDAGVDYHIATQPSVAIQSGCAIEDIYTVCIRPVDVYRDNITADPYPEDDANRTLDPNSLHVTARVSWPEQRQTRLVETSMYITDWKE
jgi:type II secretory pathway pseudopilin PulG